MKKILCIVLAFLLGCTCIQAAYRGKEYVDPPTFTGLMAYCSAFEVIDLQSLVNLLLDTMENSINIPTGDLPQLDNFTGNDILDGLFSIFAGIANFFNWLGSNLVVGFALLAYPVVVVVTVGQFITNILLYVFGFADVPKFITPLGGV